MNGAKKTIGYAYDEVGNRSQMTGPDGWRFTYAYDSAARMDDRAWHRGLADNQMQMLAAIVVCQLLVRFNFRHGARSGQPRAIFDSF